MKTTVKLLVAALLLVVAACAQQVGEIDRTQADILKKTDLAGEWYYRQTVVQAPFVSAYTFVGDQGKLERGVFEIQEKTLYFYRTYEFVNNSEQPGMTSDKDTMYRNVDGNYVGKALKDDAGATIACSNSNSECLTSDGAPTTCGKLDGCLGAECDILRKADFDCRTTTGITESVCGVVDGDEASGTFCIQPRFIYRGAPLAAFAISSHFDVIWDYNAATGEKTNVKVENTTDRYWYQREYMRVDWGMNQAANSEFTLGWLMRPEGESMNPVAADSGPMMVSPGAFYSLYSGEASGPADLPVREDGYMDFTSDYVFGAPLTWYESEGYYVPLCWFYPWYSGGIYECTSESVKVRTAFLRVQPSDYVAEKYDDDQMERFGYFRAERMHYDIEYGSTYHAQLKYIARHRIWDKYVTKADGSLDYSQMTPKPVVYYLSEGYPRELVPEALMLAQQWTVPFDDVVKFRKGGKKADQSMFILCENTTADGKAAEQWATDNGKNQAQYVAHYKGDGTNEGEFCVDTPTAKRNGDLRYSYLFSVNQPTQAGLYGYGPPSPDPLTGEIINANAYNYTAAMREGANRLADRVLVISGIKDWRDITSSTEIVEKVRANVVPVAPMQFNVPDSHAREVASHVVEPAVHEELVSGRAIEKTDEDYSGNRMKVLHDRAPEIEELFLIPEFRAIFRDWADMGNRALTDEQRERFALYKWANHNGAEERRAYYRKMSEPCLYLSDYIDNAYVPLAREWAKTLNQQLCSTIKTQIDGGADLVFDFDQFNKLQGKCTAALEGQQNDDGWTCVKVDQGSGINDYYWRNDCTGAKLRRQITEALIESENLNTYDYNLDHYAPAALYFDSKDPRVSNSQKAVKDLMNGLREQMIEDLLGRIFYSVSLHEVGHTLGLRHNFAGSSDALNYQPNYWKLKVSQDGDGKWVSKNLWDGETREQLAGSDGIRNLQYSSIMDYGQKMTFGFPGLGSYDRAAIKYGYGHVVEVFNQTPNVAPFRPYVGGDASSLLNPTATEIMDIFYRVHYSQIPALFGSLAGIDDRTDVAIENLDGDGQTEVPYRFCSDEMAGWQYLCDTWDDGPDAFEVVFNQLDSIEQYWIFAGTQQDTVLFWPENYYYGIQRGFNIARRYFQYWTFQYAAYNAGGWWESKFGIPWQEDINGGLAGTMMAIYSANMLAMQLGRPAPGTYGERKVLNAEGAEETIYEPIIYTKQGEFSNFFRLYPDQHSRAMYNEWTSGGNDMYPSSAGAIYERLAALESLTDPSTTGHFVGIDTTADSTRYLLNYQTIFSNSLFKLLGSLVNGNIKGYGWLVTEQPTTSMGPGGSYADDDQVDTRYVVPRWMIEVPGFMENPKDGVPLNPEQVEDYYFPTTKYRIPMLAAYYGMSYLSRAKDKSFIDATRVFLKDEAAGITIPPGTESIEFQNPLSGRIYVAYKPVGGDDDVYSAYYLVKLAKAAFGLIPSIEELQADFEKPDSLLAFIMGKLELMRGMNQAYEY